MQEITHSTLIISPITPVIKITAKNTTNRHDSI